MIGLASYSFGTVQFSAAKPGKKIVNSLAGSLFLAVRLSI